MNKILPTSEIANELTQASVFFQQPANSKSQKVQSPEQNHSGDVSQPAMSSRDHDTVIPRHHETAQPNMQNTEREVSREDTAATITETIRKAVRQIGKEAATHRFTTEEKVALADIVYTYTRLGYKTSENEITRIAVNWLLLDYQEHGEHSVLARMLESIHR